MAHLKDRVVKATQALETAATNTSCTVYLWCDRGKEVVAGVANGLPDPYVTNQNLSGSAQAVSQGFAESV
jgi:hypothetical protein